MPSPVDQTAFAAMAQRVRSGVTKTELEAIVAAMLDFLAMESTWSVAAMREGIRAAEVSLSVQKKLLAVLEAAIADQAPNG